MKQQDYHVISVESRKGGVGKTTAALCLAKLLLRKGWEVLFLDADITGTNVAVALDSAFWHDITNIVKVREDGKKEKQENLLRLFAREFMAGKGIPCFGQRSKPQKSVLLWQKEKINVIGSEIYDGEIEKLICNPSILFDELHAFWFVRFVDEICGQFQKEVGSENKTAIVIDNSPGYIGIGPAIQDWLTNRGVDCNKFLFVSSLDKQDLEACLDGMELLHSKYSHKWMSASKLSRIDNYRSKENNEIPELSGDDMRFVVQLLEDGKNEGIKKLDFYLNRALKSFQNRNIQLGEIFKEEVGRYQGIIINRVARRFKKGWWDYRIESDGEKNINVHKLISNEENLGAVRPDLMIEYNTYIDSQFIGEQATRRVREWQQHPDEFEWIWRTAYKNVHTISERKNEKKNELEEFWKRLNDYQAVIDDLLVRLASVPYVMRDLVRDEWHPKGIIFDFQRWIWRSMMHEFPPFKIWHESEDIARRIHLMEEMQKIMRMAAKEFFYDKVETRDNIIWDKLLFAGSAALSLVLQNLNEIPFEKITLEYGRVVVAMCALEAERWSQKKRKSKDSIAMYLAQEKFNKEEYHEQMFKRMPPPILNFFENKRNISQFYESFAKTQARILDLDQDVIFLISVIGQAVRDERKEKGYLPYIGNVAEKVIVDKIISHEEGMEECSKGFRIAESLSQFEGVISKVVDCWEIE